MIFWIIFVTSWWHLFQIYLVTNNIWNTWTRLWIWHIKLTNKFFYLFFLMINHFFKALYSWIVFLIIVCFLSFKIINVFGHLFDLIILSINLCFLGINNFKNFDNNVDIIILVIILNFWYFWENQILYILTFFTFLWCF